MKTVFYYTSAYFLDTSIEIINAIKDKVNLYVFIEITQASKQTTILNVETLPEGRHLVSAEELLSKKDYDTLKPYFEGIQSVQFVIHSHSTGLSWSTIKANRSVNRLIKRIKPEVVHFDGFSFRTAGLLPRLFRREKIVLTIHDAILHSGEKSWKSRLPRFLFLRIPFHRVYAFYSSFTLNEFANNVTAARGEKIKLQMPFFRYYSNVESMRKPELQDYVLFFGRLSKYKGIPSLLDAMPEVWMEFPKAKLVIAGSGSLPEVNHHEVLQNNPDKIIFHNRHILNDELLTLIRRAKFVVCPYTDASQSGVLMTAFGLNRPVVATDVGAFGEFVKPGINGFLAKKNDPASIAEAMINLLRGDKYLEFIENLKQSQHLDGSKKNGELLVQAYN